MMSLRVYLANLGKYTDEGSLIGKYVKLPIKDEDLERVLQEIEIDDIKYGAYFIPDIETNVIGISKTINEHTNIKQLNKLAELLESLNENEYEKLSSILECEMYSNISDIITTIENLENWDLYYNVKTEKDLGYYFIEELSSIDIPDNIKPYFNFESYGHDLRIELCGTFTTFGYIVENPQ